MNGERESVDPTTAREIAAGTRRQIQEQITQLLANWSQGDGAALARLTPLVYKELRHLAHRYMEELNATFTNSPWWGGGSFWMRRRLGKAD